jgi:hypothetical protein
MRSLISQPEFYKSFWLILFKLMAFQQVNMRSLFAKYVLNEWQITPKATDSAIACTFIAGYSVVPSLQLSNHNNHTASPW